MENIDPKYVDFLEQQVRNKHMDLVELESLVQKILQLIDQHEVDPCCGAVLKEAINDPKITDIFDRLQDAKVCCNLNHILESEGSEN